MCKNITVVPVKSSRTLGCQNDIIWKRFCRLSLKCPCGEQPPATYEAAAHRSDHGTWWSHGGSAAIEYNWQSKGYRFITQSQNDPKMCKFDNGFVHLKEKLGLFEKSWR